MRNEDVRMDFCLNGNNMNGSDNGKLSLPVIHRVSNKPGLMWIIAIGVALLMSSCPAFGQFTVQPMKLELAVTPGKLVKSILYVRSFDPNEVHNISVTVAELTQLENGEWDIIGPNDVKDPNSPHYGFDLSKLSSCKDWINFSPNNFSLAPMQVQPVELNLSVRRGIRGFYGAGILVTTSAMRGQGDVSIVLQFFIPVIIEIQGRPARHKVQATDIGLEFIKASGEYKSRSMVTMDIENNGGTYSVIKPAVRIWSFTQGHWRVITTTDFEEKHIIPGANFKLRGNIRKPLPSGKYKLAGFLYVDGRRTKRIEKEIDFVGDTSVNRLAADAPLDLEPADITMEGVPGATRTATLKVINASNEVVNIRTAMGLPSILQYGTLGDVKGEDLDCTQWIKVEPDQFTLRGEGGQQTLRIVTTMPKDLPFPYPCYFSLLALWASYPDGQQAGVTTTNICVRNREIQEGPKAVAMKVNPQYLGESKYLVAAVFGNYGMVEFTPIRVKAGLAMANGINRISTFLSGNPSLMLPFETRSFSDVLDLSRIPADTYSLAAAMEYAPGAWIDKQMAVRVSIEGGERVLDVLNVEEELSELIKVKW